MAMDPFVTVIQGCDEGKRQRTGTVQDLAEVRGLLVVRDSVSDCVSPLALSCDSV
ncbi:MAG TPA: hypothetical protein VLT36_21915 [Candidatus Dormibacteraeota bacterium]|nr:hypothetical protein [Candidatus Dormibacteraeota bacterium]